MARLILDTGVLIAGVRGLVSMTAMADDDDVALPAVAIAEYLAGVLLDDNPSRAATQRAYLDEVLRAVPVCEYDMSAATAHADLLAHTRRMGRKRGAHDLIIAATARASDRVILTTDRRADFGSLPGVTVRYAN